MKNMTWNNTTDTDTRAVELARAWTVHLTREAPGKFAIRLLDKDGNTYFMAGMDLADGGMETAQKRALNILHRVMYGVYRGAVAEIKAIRDADERTARIGQLRTLMDAGNAVRDALPTRNLMPGNPRLYWTIQEVHVQALENARELVRTYHTVDDVDVAKLVGVAIGCQARADRMFTNGDAAAMLRRVDREVMNAIYAVPVVRARGTGARKASDDDARHRDAVVVYQVRTWNRKAYVRRGKDGKQVYVRATTCRRHCMD